MGTWKLTERSARRRSTARPLPAAADSEWPSADGSGGWASRGEGGGRGSSGGGGGGRGAGGGEQRELVEQGDAGAELDLGAGDVLGVDGELEPAGEPQLRGQQLAVAGAGSRGRGGLVGGVVGPVGGDDLGRRQLRMLVGGGPQTGAAGA